MVSKHLIIKVQLQVPIEVAQVRRSLNKYLGSTITKNVTKTVKFRPGWQGYRKLTRDSKVT